MLLLKPYLIKTNSLMRLFLSLSSIKLHPYLVIKVKFFYDENLTNEHLEKNGVIRIIPSQDLRRNNSKNLLKR